jgi:anoctamin-10
MVFREIATWLTDRENHKYQSDYDQALILKRFVFEFFDCFFPLIYLGWWDLNFKVLRANIISVYTADEIRRIITESLIPYLMQMSSRKEIQAN